MKSGSRSSTAGREMPSVRRLTAILAADVAGYSHLMGADEDGTHERLKAHRRELFDPKIAEHHSRIVKTTGDGMLVEFPSVVDAVRCVVEVQREMVERNAAIPVDERIEFPSGSTSAMSLSRGKTSSATASTSRPAWKPWPSQAGSASTASCATKCGDKLGFAFEDLGEQQVKNIARPVRVSRVPMAGNTLAKPPLPLPDKSSIAVLPFANMSGDPEQEYFANGMVEEIITALSRIRWLFVIARNSSFTHKGRASDVKEVGCELGVRYVLKARSANRDSAYASLRSSLTRLPPPIYGPTDSTAPLTMSSSFRTKWRSVSPASSNRHCKPPRSAVRQNDRPLRLRSVPAGYPALSLLR